MHVLIVVAALLMGSAAQAQDTLHLTDGTEARGTILAWSPSEGVTLQRPRWRGVHLSYRLGCPRQPGGRGGPR